MKYSDLKAKLNSEKPHVVECTEDAAESWEDVRALINERFPEFLSSLEFVRWVYNSAALYNSAIEFDIETEGDVIPCQLFMSDSRWNVKAIAPADWFESCDSQGGDFRGSENADIDECHRILYLADEERLWKAIDASVKAWLLCKKAVGMLKPAKDPTAQWQQEFKMRILELSTMPAYPENEDDSNGLTYFEWLIGQALAGGCSRSSAPMKQLRLWPLIRQGHARPKK